MLSSPAFIDSIRALAVAHRVSRGSAATRLVPALAPVTDVVVDATLFALEHDVLK